MINIHLKPQFIGWISDKEPFEIYWMKGVYFHFFVGFMLFRFSIFDFFKDTGLISNC